MQRKRDLRSTLFTLAFAFLFAGWLQFAWTAITGLTFAARSSPGHVASEEDRARSRHIAVLTTIIAGCVALGASTLKKRQE